MSPVVDSAVQRAWELRDRLPERERLLVEAARSSTVDRDLERAASVYQSYIDKYPNDVIALNNMGAILEVLGRSSDALRMYGAAIETRVAPALTYSNAVGVASNVGLIALADSFLALGERDFPGASTITESALSLAIDRQEFARADSIAEHVIRTSQELRTSGHLTRASLAQLGGRMAEADRETRAAYASLVERRQLSPEEAAMLAGFSEIERRADYTSDPERLARRLRELWNDNIQFSARRRPVARRHMDFAPVFARLGDTTQARRIMQDFDSIMTPRDYPANGARIRHAVVESAVLSAQGRHQEAQSHLREACEQVPNALAICSQMAFLEIAIAFDRAGQADSAIAAYRRFVDLRALRFLSPPRSADLGTPRLAPALRRLGELLEAKGEKQAAIAAYERFLEFWADADPELQQIVRDVRDRVTRLRRATG
jgi:tetratricopeptide (TPR) repeat protein